MKAILYHCSFFHSKDEQQKKHNLQGQLLSSEFLKHVNLLS